MADKPEFVDMISEATRQRWRRPAARAAKPAIAEEKSRLSHWPTHRWLQWKLENLTPWKLKGWREKLD